MVKWIKKNNILFYILILTIIGVLPIFMPKLAYGGDLNFHLKRIEAISINLKKGLLGYPIYFKYLNNYGYASGLFYPDIFLYIPAILNTIGIPLFISYKFFLFLIRLISLISMYFSIKRINGKKSAILAITLYAFSSYIYVDMFERGAVAETLTIIFIPLVIRGLYELFYGENNKTFFLIIGLLGILYSHVISMYITTIFVLIVILLHIKKLNKKRLKTIFLILMTFLLIGSNFIFPLLEQILTGKFYFNKISETNTLLNNSVPITLTFLELPYYSLMGNYLNRWLPCGIGIIYLFLIIYYLKNKKKFDRLGKIFLYSGIICIIFSTEIFWYIPLLNKTFSFIQFPFRIFILATNLFIFCITRIFKDKKSIMKLAIISCIMFTLNLFYPFINIKTENLTNDEILYGEYLPIEYPNLNYSEENKNKISSNCKLEYEIKQDYIIKIKYESTCNDLYMELPIIYYKGYEVKINDKITEYKKSSKGLIELNNLNNKGLIEVTYKGTPIYKVTKIISLVSCVLLIIKLIKRDKYEER